MKRTVISLLILCGVATSASATLHSRLRGEALYDDVLDVTWIARGISMELESFQFGTSGITSGLANWNTANQWISSMNSANHLGYNNGDYKV